MKRTITAALLAACMLTFPCSAAAANSASPSAWASADIQAAIAQKLVPDGLLGHWQRPITRLEFADLMTTLLQSRGYTVSAVTTVNPFRDTFSENARRLCNLGVMSGTSADTFSPDEVLTRETAAACAYRLACTKSIPNPYPEQLEAYTYSDQAQISSWAVTASSFCYRCGILGGTGAGAFSPKSTLTVEQAVLLIQRFAKYASDMAPTPLTMTAGGYPLLYSNNPEILVPKRFESSGIYTADTDLTDGQTIDAEYYHANCMGAYQPMILGVVATNSGNIAESIDVVKHGAGMGTDATKLSEDCYQQFFLSEGAGTIQINAGESKLVAQDTVPGGNILNARVRLTAHGSHLNIRLVALKKEIPSQYYPTLPRGIDDNCGRTAGVFKYSDRTVNVDASSVKNFTLCGNLPSLWALNPGEFPQSIDDPLAVSYRGKASMAHFISGNYATVYHLNFTNADGKTLYIRPNDPAAKTTPGHYFLYTAQEGWHAITATPGTPFTIPLSGTVSMDFLMLGGNYGNIGFHIA